MDEIQYNVVVLSDAQLAWLKKAVKMYKANGKHLDAHLAAGAVEAAEKVDAPTIQAWMEAKMAAKYRVMEAWDEPRPSSRSYAERWANQELPGQDPEKFEKGRD